MHGMLLDVIEGYKATPQQNITISTPQQNITISQLIQKLSTMSLCPSELERNELVPDLREAQQVLSDPASAKSVVSVWNSIDDNATFTAMMEADDEETVSSIADEEIDAIIRQTAGNNSSDEQEDGDHIQRL